MQDGGAVASSLEARPGFRFGFLVGSLRTGIIFGNSPLILTKNIDPKTFLGMKMSMGAGAVVDANQYQHGVERYGGKCVGGHAMDLAIQINGNDRYPGGERPHGFAELALVQAHLWDGCNRLHYHAIALYHSVQAPVRIMSKATLRTRPLCSLDAAQAALPIAAETALHFITCSEEELPALLAEARAAKERFKPGLITYSRKVFIPLTNLCRDYCGYCTFRRDPDDPGAHTMAPDEVLAVARAGEKLGCSEVLFSLGDKPELLFPQMRETLRKLGYKSTLAYLEAMCELILRETRLLPHPNPGLLSAEWISRLAAVSPSMGLMLETTNRALLGSGAAHDNAPDKVPAKRLRTIEEAGKQKVPFTTGLLIGIGESPKDRVDTLMAIRDLHERYGHIQEVIVQNFRAKPTIPMAKWPEPSQGEMLRTLAVARLLLPKVNIQAPPNLSAPYYEDLIDAGINDWGGVSPLTPDYINPEKPWPHVEQLRLRTEKKGQWLQQRLPVYPEFVASVLAKPGLLAERLRGSAAEDGLARRAA